MEYFSKFMQTTAIDQIFYIITFTIIQYIQTHKMVSIFTPRQITELHISNTIIFTIILYIQTLKMAFFSTLVIIKTIIYIFKIIIYIQISYIQTPNTAFIFIAIV